MRATTRDLTHELTTMSDAPKEIDWLRLIDGLLPYGLVIIAFLLVLVGLHYLWRHRVRMLIDIKFYLIMIVGMAWWITLWSPHY